MPMIENVTVYKGAAILAGPRTSFLDHLIPLCHLWNIPLICTDHWVYTCAQTFYPPTELILAGHSNFQDILSGFRTFVTVEPCKLHRDAFQFGEFFYKGSAVTIAGFHGNPLKFRDAYWIERYAHEDVILVYGRYLVDYFREKGVWDRLEKTAVIGNLRKEFYLKHRSFFDSGIAHLLFSSFDKKTLLLAPTWSYPLWDDHFSPILDNLPERLQIVVKLHPFMYRLFPEKVSQLKEKYEKRKNILILDEIPLIYPLIERADVFIGNYSSVAYDFLSLNRPLFFIGRQEYPWVTSVEDASLLFLALEQPDTLAMHRQQTYSHVFSTQL